MKVVHVIHWPRSGIVNLVYNQIASSSDPFINYHVILFAIDPETNDKFLDVGARVTCFKFHSIFSVFYLFRYALEIIRLRPDVIHTHSFIPRLFTWLLMPFSRRIKNITSFHNTYPYIKDSDFRSSLKTFLESMSVYPGCCLVLTVSKYVKRYLTRHTTIPESLVRVVYPGVIVSPQSEGRDPEDTCRVVIVGRLDFQKRHDRLLRIWKRVLEELPDAQLDIVGDGVERDNLAGLARDLGIDENVNFLGFRNDVSEVLMNARFSVLTSAYEGFGLVVVESFLQKRTVVAFDVGPLGEIIDSTCGVLVTPWDLELFSDRIVYLLKNKDVALKLGKKGYESALKRFDANAMAPAIERIYYETCNETCNFDHHSC